jgi:hypothetical protein
MNVKLKIKIKMNNVGAMSLVIHTRLDSRGSPEGNGISSVRGTHVTE